MKALVALLIASSFVLQANSQDLKLLRAADSLTSLQQYDKALAILATADTSHVNVLLRMAQCNTQLGILREAIELYEKVLLRDSANKSALSHLGQLYTRDANPKMAMTCYDNLIRQDSTNGYYYKQAGNLALMMNDAFAAKAWFTTALRINPLDLEASPSLTGLLLEEESFEKADSLIRLALVFDPKSRPMRLMKARSEYEQHQYAFVINTVSELLVDSDTTLTHARFLASSYFYNNQYQEAVPWVNFILRSRHEDEHLYYYLGVAARERNDIKASVAYFTKAAELSLSDNTSIYFSNLGQSYESLKDYPNAIKAYQDAYSYSRKGILLYHLARSYDTYYKDKGIAIKYYERYLASDDTVKRAKEYAKRRLQDMGKF